MSQAKTKKKTSNALSKNNRKQQFDLQKNKLRKFSKDLPKKEDLPVVQESGGLFGLFSYNVKGDDLNRLTDKIQDKMIEQNKLLVKIVKEFHTIYDTFSALDKEYIQGILKSLSAAEKANTKALVSIEGVKINQESIKNIMDQQRQMIDVLKKFKENIEKLKHIHDVDELYDKFAPVPAKINAIEADILAHFKSVKKLNEETETIYVLLNKSKNKMTERFMLLEKQITIENENLKERLLVTEKAVEKEQVAIHKDINKLSKNTDHKITSLTNNVDKRFTQYEQTQEVVMKKLESELESKLTNLEKIMEAEVATIVSRHQDEANQLHQSLGEHKDLIDYLSHSLKLTKIISFSSIVILLIIIILMITGVF